MATPHVVCGHGKATLPELADAPRPPWLWQLAIQLGFRQEVTRLLVHRDRYCVVVATTPQRLALDPSVMAVRELDMEPLALAAADVR